MRESVTGILPLGRDSENPYRAPTIDKDGGFVFEPGETAVLYSGKHIAEVWYIDPQSKKWKPILQPSKPARVVITEKRVLFSWDKFRSDSSLGNFFERRIATWAEEKADGAKVTLGGHLRDDWLGGIWLTKSRMLQPSTVNFIFLEKHDRPVLYSLLLKSVSDDDTHRLARRLLPSIAQQRLANAERMRTTDEKYLSILEVLASGRVEPSDDGKKLVFSLPSPKILDGTS